MQVVGAGDLGDEGRVWGGHPGGLTNWVGDRRVA